MIEKLKSSLFIKNFSIYFVGLLLSGLISFFTIPIIIQKYSVELYGEFSLIQNVVFIFISFGGGWLNQCVLRYNDSATTFKVNIYRLFFWIFLPIMVVLFGVVLWINPSFVIAILGIFSLFFGGISALITTFYQSKNQANTTLIINLFRASIFAGSLLLFAYFKDYFSAVLILNFCLFASFFFPIFSLLKKEGLIMKKAFAVYWDDLRKNALKQVLLQNIKYINYGWPLALWFTISTILNVSDRYIINLYYDKQSVGIYSSVYDIFSKSIALVCSPVLIAGFPIMTQHFNSGNMKKAYQLIGYLVLFEVLLLLVTLVATHFVEDFFLLKILGISNSTENKALLMPIIVGIFLWQLAMLAHKPLELFAKTQWMLTAILITVCCSIGLNFLFLPTMGILFAAYSTIICAFLYLVLVLLFGFVFNKKSTLSGASTL